MKIHNLIISLLLPLASATADWCLNFDGVDDVVNCGAVKSINGAKQLTVEMWVRIEEFKPWKTFFVKSLDQYHRVQFQQYSAPGQLGVVVNNSDPKSADQFQGYYYTVDKVITTGDWFHLAMVYNGNAEPSERLKVYLNGSLRKLAKHSKTSGDAPALLPSTSASVLLGAETPSGKYGYTGSMDEVRIWGKALTENEICAGMNKSYNGNEPGLLMYYRFEPSEKSKETLKDLSNDSQDGRLVNFALKGNKSNWIERSVDQPTVQSGPISVVSKSFDRISISWTRGSGAFNAVFAALESDSLKNAEPLDKVTYRADSVFGSGSSIGSSGWYCVYSGNSDNVVVAKLSPATKYRLMVCDFNGGSGKENYTTATVKGNPLTVTTAKPQKITLGEIPQLTAGQKGVSLQVSSSSGLPLEIRSSNPAVATVIDGKVNCVAPGETDIIVSQPGDSVFAPVELARGIHVDASGKRPQDITFLLGEDSIKTVGDNPFALKATTSSGLAVKFISNDTSIASISGGDSVRIKKTGYVVISALQNGNEQFAPATTITQNLNIKALPIKSKDKSVSIFQRNHSLFFIAGGIVGIGLIALIVILVHGHGDNHSSTDNSTPSDNLPDGPPHDPGL